MLDQFFIVTTIVVVIAIANVLPLFDTLIIIDILIVIIILNGLPISFSYTKTIYKQTLAAVSPEFLINFPDWLFFILPSQNA